MAAFKTVKSHALVKRKTPEGVFWTDFEAPVTKKETGAVGSIDFSPSDPTFAITCSTNVKIYSARTKQVLRAFSRFREAAHSASFRHDGKLLVAGDDEGFVRVFSAADNHMLHRVYKGHSGPVHTTRFLSDGVRMLSGADDKTVRLWDVAIEKEPVTVYQDHAEYIRCGAADPSSKDLFITGSYDHTVKLFDARLDKSVLSIDHGAPVDAVLMFPSGGIILSAGGPVVKVWDVLGGGRCLTSLSHHHKPITALCFARNHQRFLSASTDRHVKVYDVSTYTNVHSLDYPGAILSVAVSPDDSQLVVGTLDQQLYIQQRRQHSDQPVKTSDHHHQYAAKDDRFTPKEMDIKHVHSKKQSLSKYDKMLRKFKHSEALDAAMDLRVRKMTPEVTVAVIRELRLRGRLRAALAGRDHKSLSHILRFIQQNICDMRFTGILTEVSETILDLYWPAVAGSEVEAQLLALKEAVASEIKYERQILPVLGMFEAIFHAASMNQMQSTPAAPLPLATAPQAATEREEAAAR